jgi:hypothetical protein
VLLDERGDLEHQRPVGAVWVGGRAVHPFGKYRAEQVKHVARQPDPDPVIPRVHLVKQVRDLSQERADEGGQPAGLPGKPGRGQPGQPGRRQAQHVPGEDQHQHPVRVVGELYQTLAGLRRAGATLLIVEQDLRRAMTECDDLVCLLEGRVALATPVPAVSREQVVAAYFGEAAT